QFRGFQGSGMGSGNPPAEWNIESGKNILWKRPLDGLGHSGPIAFGNRIFLTTAVSEQKRQSIPTGQVGGNGESASDAGNWRWQVAAFDLGTGVEIWRRTVATGVPTIKRHIKATHANSTPATDGRHVVAFFGSEGLYCLDVDGNLLWEKHFGKLHSGPYDAPQLEWGFASSPIIHDGCVILQCDCLNTGFVSILKVSDGQEIRRIKRNDVATWSTPAVIQTETETQLICNGYREMAGYNLRTGEQLWTIQGGGDVPVPTPLTAQGLILLTNGHGRSPIYAVSPSARGNLTPAQNSDRLPTGLVWWQPRGGTYIPTPIIAGDFLYLFSSPGVLTARETRTGRLVYRQRAGGQCSASAVASSSHLYLCSETGTVSVIRTGSDYELSAHNEMQAPVFATPAIVRNRLLIRTTRNLYAIGTAESQPMP
ncbi:MAG: PQQ-binding-like beta-propeller repeat protein, partial [Planctomycetaceae bacterium]